MSMRADKKRSVTHRRFRCLRLLVLPCLVVVIIIHGWRRLDGGGWRALCIDSGSFRGRLVAEANGGLVHHQPTILAKHEGDAVLACGLWAVLANTLPLECLALAGPEHNDVSRRETKTA